MTDNYSRFSGLTDDYRLYRPRYPQSIISVLEAECGLSPDFVIADIGSGTGLLTDIFLKNGNCVYGVEPNAEMRVTAETDLQKYPKFTSVDATAEATTLSDNSVDMIVAGQAFHWFDRDLARREFLRILKPDSWLVLVYNIFSNDGNAFMDAFEHFWKTYVMPNEVFNARKRPDYITNFFGADHINEKSLDNFQICDFEALKGRVKSVSRAPRADDPRYPAMIEALQTVFNTYQEDGKVTLTYDTFVVYGHLVEG